MTKDEKMKAVKQGKTVLRAQYNWRYELWIIVEYTAIRGGWRKWDSSNHYVMYDPKSRESCENVIDKLAASDPKIVHDK